MSRHDFTGIEPDISVSIGWDRPLNSFFVQVLRRHPHLDGEDDTIVWHGTEPGELKSASDAIAIASRWARVAARRAEGKRDIASRQRADCGTRTRNRPITEPAVS